jgi:proteic killer suppression protein
MAIRDYHDRRTADFVEGKRVREFEGFANAARKAIARLDATTRLMELWAMPGARFEVLQGDRAGQCSIRINDQWRVCFRWAAKEQTDHLLTALGEPYDVQITDYH